MSVSGFFDRQRAELDRYPRTFVDPKGLGALIPTGPINTEPVPIPRDAIPRRVKSHDVEVDGGSFPEQILSAMLAEDRRLRNLLPPAPRGFEWHGETQFSEDRDPRRYMARIVYTLREIS